MSEVKDKLEAQPESDLEQAMQDAVQAIEKREDDAVVNDMVEVDDSDDEGVDVLNADSSEENAEPAPAKLDAASAVTEALIAAKKELEEALEQTRTQYSELRSKWMRAAADLDNYKKRAKRERAEAVKFGNERLIKDILPIIDDLDRTLEVMDSEETEMNAESVLDGIRMVRKKFLSQLEKHEVVSFESQGEPFDPAQHEAVHQMHSDKVAAGAVVNEMRRGFFLSGRLLRPSMVTVSLGAEKAAAESPNDASAEAETHDHEQNDETVDSSEEAAENTESGE